MTGSKNSPENERFGARWSRRKQQVKLEQKALEQSADALPDEMVKAEPDTTGPASAEQLQAEKLAKLNALKDEDMPDIATLDEDSDFSQFMSINVSEELRKLALRKLFQGKGYNVRDGLDEYDGDYTSFEKLDPGTITADMKYRLELEAEKLKAQLEKEAMDEPGELLDDDTEEPEIPNETQDEPSVTEDQNETDSGDQVQAVEGEEQKQPDIKSLESEQPSNQIIRGKTGEKQT